MKIVFILVLSIITINVFSAHLENRPVELKQPNGEIINCFVTGDEYHRRVHDSKNYTIIKNPGTGYYVYAIKRGVDLVPSDYIVGQTDPVELPIEPNYDIPLSAIESKRGTQLKSANSVNLAPNKGNFSIILIFIRFADQEEYTESINEFENIFNGADNPSLYTYYKEVSNNQLLINTSFFPSPDNEKIISYQDEQPRNYYLPYDEIENPIGYKLNEWRDRENLLLRNAIKYVENQIVEKDIDIDLNNDGSVDNLMFFLKGCYDAWGNILWPMSFTSADLGMLNGKKVTSYNKQLHSPELSVLAHEFFHALGAPDLYRYKKDGLPVGGWDNMGSNFAQHMTTYSKWKYGKWFETIPVITETGTYKLKPVSGESFSCFKIPSPNSLTEFFMVEYRKKEGMFESGLPFYYQEGLIIYRINTNGLWGNAGGPPDEIYVYRPYGSLSENGLVENAAFSQNVNRVNFSDITNPSCFLSNGEVGGIKITDILEIGDEISFTVNVTSKLPVPRYFSANQNQEIIKLNWNTPESSDNKLLGYNIYQTGMDEALNKTIINDTTFNVNLNGVGEIIFYLTAVYENEESVPVMAKTYYSPGDHVLTNDSLALVKLFNSCNGPGWINNENWLETPVKNWFGISVENGRVISIILKNNKLTGRLPDEVGNLKDLQNLYLRFNEISGQIPTSIGNLVELKNLELNGNPITGTIPKEIGNLRNVNYINFQDVDISGEIPEEIGNLFRLERLFIRAKITGSIPEEIGRLKNLMELSLDGNQLSGSIPAEISNLTNLWSLELSDNNLTGSIPGEIGKLVYLENLLFSGNNLSGSIPNEIGSLSKLKYLNFYNNQLTNNIPEGIWNLANLESINFELNELNGSISSEIGNLIQLTDLNLSRNNLLGSLPPEIGSLKNLVNISLWGNQLSGIVPSQLTQLNNLQTINLLNNNFNQIQNLDSLTKLNYLNLSENFFTFEDIETNLGIENNISSSGGEGKIFYNSQGKIGNIQKVFLQPGTDFTLTISCGGENNQYQWFKNGSAVDSVQNNPEFSIDSIDVKDYGEYVCYVTNTKVTDLTISSFPITLINEPIPTANQQDSLVLVKLYNDCDGKNWKYKNNWLEGRLTNWYGVTVENGRVININLESNNLTGEIPDEICSLSNLSSLNLSNNKLSGNIPSEVAEWENLSSLDLSNNMLIGMIPRGFGDLTKFEVLELASNKLTGRIPREISRLLNLNYLNLSENELSGSIPKEIGNLSDLTHLNLRNNKFYGSVPSEIKQLHKLDFLHLTSNNLEQLPDLTTMENISEFKIEDNMFTFVDIEPNMSFNRIMYSPQANIGDEQTIWKKEGESCTFSVDCESTNNRYQWFKNGIAVSELSKNGTFILSEISINEIGIYECQITNTIAVDLTIQSMPISLNVCANLTGRENISICEGDDYYGWSTGGEYSRTISAVTGCDSTVTTYLTVIPRPEIPEILQENDTLKINNLLNGQWYLNDTIIGDMSAPLYVMGRSGKYQVSVINDNGCYSLLSDPFYAYVTNTDLTQLENIKVYPNPTTGVFTISGLPFNKKTEVAVYNISGKIVKRSVVDSQEVRVDINNFTPGIYLLKLNDRNNFSVKIVK
ncbi:MAG: M6 family metalloprotease domain-containing protein, partial [Prolixibacteraceae bacterium]|nr:M6 family metalloprotease domain-containing protein [Prolixibacteraceae bacterium]